MSNDLEQVWRQVELLLNQGINVIPVRDREEIYKDKIYAKKTPYREWQKYQLEKIGRQDLFHMMEKFNTTAVAMVCGAISGNLEVIDIDVKHHPGIDARLLTDLKELYPDLFAKIKRNLTGSGGQHLIYRVDPAYEIPGSMQLAIREATPEELEQRPKRKTYCFIETRGTGALCTVPPCLGYQELTTVPIPMLSWEERCSLIELCRSYNLYIKEEKPYKPNKAEANYYDENPFEHYNRTVDVRELMTNCGWAFVAQRGQYLRFTKPGGKAGDVHGSFDTSKRVFSVFSTNADLEGERAYNPATILAHYSFGGDKQKTYQWLVAAGYGRIRPQVEDRIVRRLAISGEELPANVSESAKIQYEQTVAQIHEQHPYGVFWEFDDDEVKISRERLYAVAEGLGFRYHKSHDEVVQVCGEPAIFIHKRDDREFYDALKNYIHDDDGDILEDICNAYEAFIEKHGKFTMRRLAILDTSLILHDTRDTCYKFYQNGLVRIIAAGFDLFSYETVSDRLIWASKVQGREFQDNTDNSDDCLYVDFLNNAVSLASNRDHIMKCIGYLAHDWKDETTGYIIVLTEQCEDPKHGGGTGKNLFCNLLNLTTSYTSVPGSQSDLSKNFLQSWKGQRVFGVSDAPEKFPLEFLKELSTGQGLLKKLFKDDVSLGVADLPKFIIQTNFSFHITDGGLKRRIVFIEFTDFFTKAGGVKKHYGSHFPADWKDVDYFGYDNFVFQCVQKWLQSDLEIQNSEMSDTGWHKQFIINHHIDTFEFIEEHFQGWVKSEAVFNSEIQELYNRYMDFYGKPKYKKNIKNINDAIEEYADKKGFSYQRNIIKTRNYGIGISKKEKCNLIRPKEPPF